MTQAIIAGLIGLLAGFGIGNWTAGDGEYEHEAQEEVRHMMGQVEKTEDALVPLADDFISMRPEVVRLAAEAISPTEQDGLLFMREEEKLARDVYTTLYSVWNNNIFSNIAQSEQTHTESVRMLLEKYDIPDPVVDDSVGVFVNEDLQTLYNDLVTQGKKSMVDALRVGALIEDLDIKDLKEQIALTDNEDIALVYGNLQRGSRNHLRAFTQQLEWLGQTYIPQYISQAEYDEILLTERETGAGQSRGWGSGRQGGVQQGNSSGKR